MPRKNDAGGPLFTGRLLFVTEVSASDLLSFTRFLKQFLMIQKERKRQGADGGGGNGGGGGSGGHSPDTRWK